MSEPIRVLQVLGHLNLGGAESRVMDMYRAMNRDHVQFDFCIHKKEECFFEKEIKEMGGRVYRIPRFKVFNYFAYKKAWSNFFKEHKEFAAIHGHMTSTAAIYLPVAKKAGVPLTIAHARSAGVDHSVKGIITKIIRRPLKNRTDFCFTCSGLAGQAVYGNEACKSGRVHIIPNAINASKYLFNKEIRGELRSQLDIEDNLVIGHVGTFRYAKNHMFLLEVFAEILKLNSNARLLIVGDGELRGAIENKIRELGISNEVIIAGLRSNVADYMNAMDLLLFPSFYEGLPGTVVEAQASGLPCLISTNITSEVGLSDIVRFKSLEDQASDWADEALSMVAQKRETRLSEVQKAGFDIELQVPMMEEFYKTGVIPEGLEYFDKGKNE